MVSLRGLAKDRMMSISSINAGLKMSYAETWNLLKTDHQMLAYLEEMADAKTQTMMLQEGLQSGILGAG
jgi:hypothetical protein